MNDSTRPRAFPPIPELATDAELSGLFRLLEEGDRLDSQNSHSTMLSAPGQRETSAPPQSESEGSELARSAADRNARRGTLDPVDDALRVAFKLYARAVAAELNR